MPLRTLSNHTKALVYGNTKIIADFIVLDREGLSPQDITFANLTDEQKHADLETPCLQSETYNTIYFLPSVMASMKRWDAFIALFKHSYTNNPSASIIIVGNSSLILPNEIFEPSGFIVSDYNKFDIHDSQFVKFIITKYIANPKEEVTEENKDFGLPSPNYHLELKQPQTEKSTEDTSEKHSWCRLVEKQATARAKSNCIVM